MKKLLPLLLLLAVTACRHNIEQITIPINTGWKFITGDNLDYANPAYNDSSWKMIQVNAIWEDQGYEPYDGYAWYRTVVVIPSEMKKKAYLHDSVEFYMGKINNFDQTFLNGELIGINGQNVPAGTVADTFFIHGPTALWNYPRRYVLAAGDPRIRWDRNNIIAVRVYDQGGQGGMYTGNQQISMVDIKEYFVCDHESHPFIFRDSTVSKTFMIRNTSPAVTLDGDFTVTAVNKVTGREIYRMETEMVLKPLTEREYAIDLPAIDQSSLVTYAMEFEDAGETDVCLDETPYILTPPAADAPRISGTRVTGARPGHPFLFAVAATGLRPMTFQAEGLPNGLTIDGNTGIITGMVSKKGDYEVTLTAVNAWGQDSKTLLIKIGDMIALTPPMGWNSWNCWGLTVDEDKVLASARAFRDHGLTDHGWQYINIDDGWEIPGDQEPRRDPEGNILTNDKFPDMKRLGDSLHAMGLKFGIYSSPGPLTCGGYTGSYGHELQDARSYAAWGIDYLKYDWCSYDHIATDTSLAERQKPYRVMRAALDQVGRDIVYSLCQYGMSDVWTWGAQVGGNLWRTTGDITDTWESLKSIGFSQIADAPFAGPGHWNDPDMLVVGWVGWGPSVHPTHLTPDEQYTHISLWCLLSAPLLLGCDLQHLDAFTLSLLTNDEVLAVDQDPLGQQAVPLVIDGNIQVWGKEMSDGSLAAGIFNLGETTVTYPLDLYKVSSTGHVMVHDLWRQEDLGEMTGTYQTSIPAHGVVMVKFNRVTEQGE
jgi:alpha-galactosidase